MARHTFRRIYVIIICIHLIVSNAGAAPLVNENKGNDALFVSMQYNENTRILQRIVQISQSLDSENEHKTINIFVPNNNDRFDSWGG